LKNFGARPLWEIKVKEESPLEDLDPMAIELSSGSGSFTAAESKTM
jgi:hypothetical protein